MLKLYYAPGTCALACWISLEWAGADYEVEKAHLASENFRKINPLGMVPALDIGGSRAMTQSDAILQYIAERFPQAHLGAEDDIDSRFEFNETMAFLTGDFHPAFWPFFTPQRFTTDDNLEAVRQASHARVERVLSHLDNIIGDSNHVYANRRSVADAYAYIMASWSSRFPKSWKDFPNLANFMQLMMNDEAVKKVKKLSSQ